MFQSNCTTSGNPRQERGDFSVDSSAFSTCRFLRWCDEKYGKMRTEHKWVKVHLMTGVKTNIVTSVEITDGNSHDSPFLPLYCRPRRHAFK